MELARALQECFGFSEFRPGQREAVEAAVEGRDVLVVMPTGSGKSLCYQLPALLRNDLTIVVSPLVALMQDQVEALQRRGFGDAVALVNAQQAPEDNADALERARSGRLRLLYAAPERFALPRFIHGLRDAKVGLFVVDEAHCVSQWGHDFRPDYLRMGEAAGDLGAQAIIASTATATPRVAKDIVHRLRLRDPVEVATGFDRPNISFSVAFATSHQKRAMVAEALSGPDARPAIVYAGTRAGTEELADHLSRELGEQVLAYHAGLDRTRRAEAQRSFLNDEVGVIVATNAFGMGVDKPNVRTVVHASVPQSLEAYYQEAGRGGRDGLPARAVLLAERRDKALHLHFIRRDEVDQGALRRLFDLLVDHADAEGGYALSAHTLERRSNGTPDQLPALLGHLARAGAIAPSPAPADRVVGTIISDFDRRVAAAGRASIEDGSSVRWRQHREIWDYVEGSACRRRAMLYHFGDGHPPSPRPSGVACCDVCDASLAPAKPTRAAEDIAGLDKAIVSVAGLADPAVGRITCAEILHGARTKKLARNAYDGLPAYGSQAHLSRPEILERLDELIGTGTVQVTNGKFPVLRVPNRRVT